MHERPHMGALERPLRGEAFGLRRDLIEIFADDRGIDHDLAVMIERRHHSVGIEREIVGLELIARQEIELHLRERNALGVEHETHPLAAGRLRRIVEREHGRIFSRSSALRLSWPGIAREDGRKRPYVPAISLRCAMSARQTDRARSDWTP